MSSPNVVSKSFLKSDTINDEFFTDIIERKLNTTRDKFKILHFSIEPATAQNQNFASVVYRAKISIEILETQEEKLVVVIIKALLSKIVKLKDLAIFEREIDVYKEVIKHLEHTFLEKADEKVEFAPRCIKIESKTYQIIVLDDLKEDGYKMADRKVGVDLDHSKLVMSKLAKFHAASVILFQKDSTISPHLNRQSMLTTPEKFEKDSKIFTLMYMKWIETIKTMAGFEKITEKISQWDIMKLISIFLSVAEPMQCGLVVLNHGDDWLNNMMFKYDHEGRVIDVKFIDFQLSFWGSPATDLIYYLVSSVADDVKINYFDDLIQHYHNEFLDSLKKLDYDQTIPTLYELHLDLLQKGGAFSFHMMFVMFIAKFNSDEELNLEDVFSHTEASQGVLHEAFNNQIYRKALALWLPFLNKRGYLDTLLPSIPPSPFLQDILQKWTFP